MQLAGYELPRIPLPRTSVNKGEHQGSRRKPPAVHGPVRTYEKRVGTLWKSPGPSPVAPSPVAIPATSWLRLAVGPRLSRPVSYSEPHPKGPRTAGVHTRD